MKNLKAVSFGVCILAVSLLCLSCAEMRPPTPYDVLKNPLGTTPLEKGMKKEQVVNLWGQPNEVNEQAQIEKWAETKEEWVYYARYPVIPVNYNYLSESKYLYFEGDTLINWKTESEKNK